MEEENITLERIQALKIRFFPNINQKKVLTNYLGIYRLFYNTCLTYIQKNKIYDFRKVRDEVIKIINAKYKNNDWFDNLYFDCKSLASKEICIAYKTNFKKGTKFDMKFKSKCAPYQNLKIDHRVIKLKDDKLHIFVAKIKDNINIRNRDLKKVQNVFKKYKIKDSEITRDKYGVYYLIINYQMNEKIKITKKLNTMTIDQGTRTLYNCYTEEGILMKLGNNIEKLYKKHATLIQKLEQKKDHVKGKTKKNIKKRISKLNKKIKNIVYNQQNQITKFVASNTKTIITCDLNIKKIINKQQRNLSKNVVKDITKKHIGRLKLKLKEQCDKYNTELIQSSESYSSLTCTNCFNQKQKSELKGSKIYECQNCHIKLDRDYNACRNIYIKYLFINKK